MTEKSTCPTCGTDSYGNDCPICDKEFDFNFTEKKKYKVLPGLVNGEIVSDLLKLCNGYFVNVMVQPYSGANKECMFCGTTEDRKGRSHHSAVDCPFIKFKDIIEKHSDYIRLNNPK